MEKGNIKNLKELIDLFEHNIKQYKGKHYDELYGLTEEEIKIVDTEIEKIISEEDYEEFKINEN